MYLVGIVWYGGWWDEATKECGILGMACYVYHYVWKVSMDGWISCGLGCTTC